MMWGDVEVCWNWVGLASEWIRTNGYYLMRSYPMAGVYNAYLMHSMHTGAKDTDSLSFLWLMGLTRQFEATDPRDRVFALLGLPTTDTDPDHDPLFMEPDYALPLLQIYKRLVIRIVHQSRNLKILTAVQHGPLLKEEFPSWVPQWHYSYTHTLAPSAPGVNHAAAADVPLFLEDLHAGSANTLTATGLSIDTISEASRVMSDEDFSLPGTHRLHQIWAKHFEKLGACSTRESLEKVYCWTVTAGKDWYGMLVEDSESHWADFLTYWRKFDPVDPSLVSTYEQKPRDAAHDESQDGDADRFLEAASNACSGRRIFITSKGHVGLGPAALRTDDRVFVLFGSIVPFVLRRKNLQFQLVGECYVNDLMQGEAISEWRKGHLTDEKFELR
ncbi:hypothetical protein B0A49_01725 [Cryomyces minteri]|uniref:Heterokaryon incompatibility domain-containing protein n=1 Tax=Cryomyces minteri TaxID=331657 RepID=A0A4U0XIN1_9PEZI|nr:hypothetical protein B0A49_01725 [Cryomyces minteri]